MSLRETSKALPNCVGASALCVWIFSDRLFDLIAIQRPVISIFGWIWAISLQQDTRKHFFYSRII